MLEKEKDTLEETEPQVQTLQEFKKRVDVLSIIVRHRPQLQAIFQKYSSAADMEKKITPNLKIMDLYYFSKFCVQFNIVPYLMSSGDAVTIYRKLTQFDSKKRQPGIEAILINYKVSII